MGCVVQGFCFGKRGEARLKTFVGDCKGGLRFSLVGGLRNFNACFLEVNGGELITFPIEDLKEIRKVLELVLTVEDLDFVIQGLGSGIKGEARFITLTCGCREGLGFLTV
jgi:hypothetical protein